MPGILDWLQTPAYQQAPGVSPQMMQMAGVPQTSRLQAIGQMLMGFGQGVNRSVAEGRGGGLGSLAGGAMGLAGAGMAQQQGEREQTMQSLLQQAQIAKLLKGDQTEFGSLIAGLPKEEQARLMKSRAESLASDSKPPTWQPATPEQLASSGFPQGTQVSSLGEFKPPPGEYFTSPKERESLDIQRLSALAAQGNAAATRELAQAQFGALETERGRQESERKSQAENRAADDVRDLRKEFDALPEVKSYKTQLPTFKSMVASIDDPGSDIDFVYGTAKILDPLGAVQQGDADTIRSNSTLNSVLGGYLSLIEGNSRLGPERRRQLLDLARRRLEQGHQQYQGAVGQFSDYATRSRVDPSMVVRDIGAPPPLPDFGAPAPGTPAPVPAGTSVPSVVDDILGSVYGP